MPITIEKLPDEPIIITVISGHIEAEEFITLFDQVAALLDDSDVTMFNIGVLRDLNINFMELMKLMREVSAGHVQGSPADTRLRPVYVGNDSMAKLVSNMMGTQSVKIPLFRDMESALAYARHALNYMA